MSRKRGRRTGLEQRFSGDFTVQIIFCASLPEQSAALGPTSRPWALPGRHRLNRVGETLANDVRIHTDSVLQLINVKY